MGVKGSDANLDVTGHETQIDDAVDWPITENSVLPLLSIRRDFWFGLRVVVGE